MDVVIGWTAPPAMRRSQVQAGAVPDLAPKPAPDYALG